MQCVSHLQIRAVIQAANTSAEWLRETIRQRRSWSAEIASGDPAAESARAAVALFQSALVNEAALPVREHTRAVLLLRRLTLAPDSLTVLILRVRPTGWRV